MVKKRAAVGKVWLVNIIVVCTTLFAANCGNQAERFCQFGEQNAKQGRWVEAIAEYSRAINIDPNLYAAYVGRAIAYYYLGNYDQTIADCSIAPTAPVCAEAYSRRACTYLQGEKYNEAIADCDRALELNPTACLAYKVRAVAYLKMWQWDKAVAEYTKAIECQPNDVTAYTGRAIANFMARQYKAVIADCNVAIKLSPEDAKLYYLRGLARSKPAWYSISEEALKESAADFREAIRLNPECIAAYKTAAEVLGCVYGSEFLNKGLELSPEDEELYELRISCNTIGAGAPGAGYSQAIADLTKLIEFHPDDPKRYINRGAIYMLGLNDYGRAAADFSQAIKLNPSEASAYSFRAAAYMSLSRYRAAIDDCNKAIELNPMDPSTYLIRAVCNEKLGNYTDAAADYAKFSQLAQQYKKPMTIIRSKEMEQMLADWSDYRAISDVLDGIVKKTVSPKY